MKYFSVITVLFFISCGSFFRDEVEKEPLARVGDVFLYEEDLDEYINDSMSDQDSAAFVVNYINKWASKQLLLSKSKINLSEEKLEEFDRLVADYKTDLYTRAYIEALVQQSQDTAVSQAQLNEFYEIEKENFKLDEKLVQLRFVELPVQFLNKAEVVQKIRNYGDEDKAYLDSIAVQFRKIHLNDSIWVSASDVIKEILPLNYTNVDRHLKKSQFFELQDSLGVYLGKVTSILQANDIAPLSYIEPNIRQVILNRRRIKYMKQLEADILEEATKSNEFEVYGKD